MADVGDVRANLYNLAVMADEVTEQFNQIFRLVCLGFHLTLLQQQLCAGHPGWRPPHLLPYTQVPCWVSGDSNPCLEQLQLGTALWVSFMWTLTPTQQML